MTTAPATTGDPTLHTLIAVSSARPKMRFLVCPVEDCRGAVELKGGVYRCAAGHETGTLIGLAVKA
jgi:hypothetical protein